MQHRNIDAGTRSARSPVALLPAFIATALSMGLFCHFVTALAPLVTIALAVWSAVSVCLCLHAVGQHRRPRKPALILAEMLNTVHQRDDKTTQAHAEAEAGARSGEDKEATSACASPPAPEPARILLVDANPLNRQHALLRLRALGYAAEGVADGEAAVLALALALASALAGNGNVSETGTGAGAGAGYQLVLIDCKLPETSGYETARRIRRNERGGDRHLPIIGRTALAEDQHRCLGAGMDDFLTGPLHDGEFDKMLARWLPLKPAMRAA